MTTCFTCRYSFASSDPQEPFKTVRRCWPGGDREREQLAYAPCDSYQRREDATYDLDDTE